MRKYQFKFFFPTRIEFGLDNIERVGKEAVLFGKQAIIVTGKKAMKRTGILQKVIERLSENNVSYVLYDKVEQDPTVKQIDEAYSLLKGYDVDVIIALGGGSTIDVAKALSILFTNYGSIWDYVNLEERSAKDITIPTIPVIAIPTTAGTGSEATPFCVVTHEKTLMKKGIQSRHLYPKVALLDPTTLIFMSKPLIAYTGMDAFAQALESFISKKANVLTDMISFEALELTSRSLIRSYQNTEDIASKADMMLGACLAGISIGQIDVGLAHAMAQALGAHYKIPHGLAVAALTPTTMFFNIAYELTKFQKLTNMMKKYFDICDDRSEGCVQAVEKILKELNLSSEIDEIEISRLDVIKMAKTAMSIGSIRTNIKEVTRKDIEDIYIKTFKLFK